jgi:Transglycosylase SLT domain
MPRLSRNTAFDAHINEAARKHGVDVDLVRAIIQVESGFNPRAVSRKGAKGLMQLMPDTARDMGARNALDPKQNIFAGVRYLRFLLDAFDGDLTLATAAYNAGPTVVKRHGGIPPYEETLNYVDRVHSLLGLQPPGLEPPPALLDALFTPEDLGPVLASALPRPSRWSRLRSLLRPGMGGRDDQADEGSGHDSDRNG